MQTTEHSNPFLIMEKLKNIPSLRFPEFRGNWEVCKLSEVMNFKVTNSFSRENLNYDNGDVKNIHYGDIHTKFQTLFDITKEMVPFVNEGISIERISEDFYCKEGDIIFADASEDINDVGKSIEIKNLNGERLLSGLHTLLARPIENKFKIGFNGYLFKSNNVRVRIQKESQGSKVLSINVGRISGIDLSFPNIQEQTKIASFLTAVDDKLQALKQKKTLLEQYKKGVIQKIFSQELRFKDDDGNEYPDWVEKKLGEVGKFYAGGDLNKLDYQKEKNDKYIYPIYSNSSGEGLYGYSTSFQFNKNCVSVSGRGNLGYANVRNQNFSAIVRLIVIEPKEYISPKFLEEIINSINFVIESTGVPQLTVPQISAYTIPVPCLEEQTKIANFLSAIDDKINHCQVQIEKMEVWKKGLLQQMFV